MNIIKKQNEYYPELSSFTFTNDDENFFSIFLTEDASLNFTITNLETIEPNEEYHEFIITKSNLEVYTIFKELIDDFEKLSPVINLTNELLTQFDEYKDGPFSKETKHYNKNLYFKPYVEPVIYRDRCITWQSDCSYHYMINTLRIKETPKGIKISIKTATNTDIFLGRNVKIKNSYSKQNPYGFLFMNMYYKLQKIDPNYHQINLFELWQRNRNKQKLVPFSLLPFI